jgi:PAS domain S-box-containing protein
MAKPTMAKKNIGTDFERKRIISLINSMVDAVIAVDENLKITLYNGAALNILDLNTSLNGTRISDVCRLIDKNQKRVDIEKFIESTTSQKTSRDYRLKYKDGSDINIYLSVAIVSLGFGTGGKGGFIIIMRDITREKSLEEERDEFISVVSHELRTPIAIAEGNISNAQMIISKSDKKNSDVDNALDQAHGQVLFLGGLINDLATLSRAERGKLNIEIEPINAHELVRELAQNYEPDAKSKGIDLRVHADAELELLQSSKLYVREVLQNFITNAIKYTDKGSVTISAHSNHGGVCFEIADTGIGISRGDQAKIFSKFFRSGDFRTRKNTGTGLGLYVTNKLANMLHAKISVDSKLDEGSVFSITIPNLKPKKK